MVHFRVVMVASIAILLARESFAGQRDEASRAFARASKRFEAGDYAGAITGFEQAYRLSPHHVVLCNIARAHERLDQVVRAAAYYRRCLSEGADRSRIADKVRALLEAVESRITRVLVRSPGPGGEVRVDGEALGRTPLRVLVDPGTRVLEVRREGAKTARAVITARGGEALTVDLVPGVVARPPAVITRPPAAVSHPTPPSVGRRSTSRSQQPGEQREARGLSQGWFWTGAVVTAGLVATTAVLGAQALSLKSDYEATPTRAGYEEVRDRRLLTNVVLGAAVAAGATTTILFFHSDFGGKVRKDDGSIAVGIGLQGIF